MSPDVYVREVLVRELETAPEAVPDKPFKDGLGMWAKYGISLSEEEIDQNRKDMLGNFGEDF
jgi:hypothetical protein